MAEEKKVIYGDMNSRLFASTLDLAIIYLLVQFITNIIYAHFYPAGSEFNIYTAKVIEEFPQMKDHSDQVMMVIMSKYPDGMVKILNQMVFIALLQFFLVGIYFITTTKYFGGTLGKKLLGMKVVDSITGKPISLLQSIIRYLSYVPSILVLGMGLITGALNKRKRCWHDMLADTIVVYSEDRWYKRMMDPVLRYFNLK